MKLVKHVLLGTACVFFGSSAMALNVEFNPHNSFFSAYIGDDDFQRQEITHSNPDPQTIDLATPGGTLSATLEVVRSLDQVNVLLNTAFNFGAAANSADAGFAGDFTITEPAYVEFFGDVDGNLILSAAVSHISAACNPTDGSESHYEYEYQQGQVPDVASINGASEDYGYLEGNLRGPRLVPAGTYSFDIYLSAMDNSLNGDIVFNTLGNAGFRIIAATRPEPQPEPTPEPTPEPQPEPTPEPQPEPTPQPPTISSTIEAINSYLESGDINGKTLARNLQRDLAQASDPSTAPKAAAKLLKNVVSDLQVQSGKKITPEAASDLIAQIQYVLDQYPTAKIDKIVKK